MGIRHTMVVSGTLLLISIDHNSLLRGRDCPPPVPSWRLFSPRQALEGTEGWINWKAHVILLFDNLFYCCEQGEQCCFSSSVHHYCPWVNVGVDTMFVRVTPVNPLTNFSGTAITSPPVGACFTHRRMLQSLVGLQWCVTPKIAWLSWALLIWAAWHGGGNTTEMIP